MKGLYDLERNEEILEQEIHSIYNNIINNLTVDLSKCYFIQISVLTYIFLFEDLEECLNEGFTPYSVVHKYLMRFYIQSGVNC